MAIIEKNGKTLEVNDDGFLLKPEEWDRSVALVLAEVEEGLAELTDEHWKVIEYIRAFFVENRQAPIVRKVCQMTGFPLKHIYELFPSGPAKGACKLAGLPKPDGCV
jgi:TusE/DsrC/DsvC family sulfur relay protein